MTTSTTVPLSTAEVCDALGGLHPSTVSRWVKDGRITPIKRGRGQTGAMLFDPADVERLRAELAAKAAG